jgi:hypothetical protein
MWDQKSRKGRDFEQCNAMVLRLSSNRKRYASMAVQRGSSLRAHCKKSDVPTMDLTSARIEKFEFANALATSSTSPAVNADVLAN